MEVVVKFTYCTLCTITNFVQSMLLKASEITILRRMHETIYLL